ncbi:hypothetical protein [Streptomyces sp. ODS05-4]|uniref:hypothetical protein n=1 Tax=Streptomyces sp. ODS05-4 TaxID=2944939 RepID=UPI00210E2BE5|nr:hypothetical protein [Streptomyces sp. ODS05-4]
MSLSVMSTAALVAGCGTVRAGDEPGASSPSPVRSAGTTTPAPSPSALAALDGAEILRRSSAAMSRLDSYRIRGVIRSPDDTTTLNVFADRQGMCTGTAGLSSKGEFEVLRNARGSWVRPSKEFWQSTLAQRPARPDETRAQRYVEGKYLRIERDDPRYEGVFALCDLIEDASQTRAGGGTVSTVGETRINGMDAVKLEITDAGAVTAFHVATTGEPHLLSTDRADPENPGQLNYSDFGEPVRVTTPPPELTMDFAGPAERPTVQPYPGGRRLPGKEES